MKAIRLETPGEPLVTRDVDRPGPGPEEALVKVAGCGVCHTDIGFWRDGVPTGKKPPLTLGHEVSGVVVQAPKSHPSLEGREVIVPAIWPCGECDLCGAGRGNACRRQVMPGNHADGGFAEYLAAPARVLCVVENREGYELEELSVVADAVTTPYQAVIRSGLEPGDLAVVVGAGGVGGYCIQIAAAFGAKVIAIDLDEGRLETIREHGAHRTLNATGRSHREIRKAVGEAAAELDAPEFRWKIFECSGTGGGQETAFGLLGPAAMMMVIGFTLEKQTIRLSNLMAFDAAAQGTWGCKPELYPEALRLITEGRVTLKQFIQTFPMSQGPEILRQVADHELVRRAILVPEGGD
jgi:6-hydroxycyclohex-1-ene-1-carbonyl-CoA dehydrogenase